MLDPPTSPRSAVSRRPPWIALATFIVLTSSCALSAGALREDDPEDPDSNLSTLNGLRLETLELQDLELRRGHESFALAADGAPAWIVACESNTRIHCFFDPATRSSTAAPIRLRLSANSDRSFSGQAITADESYQLEGPTPWVVRTSSTVIAEISSQPQLELRLAPELSQKQKQTIAALALALEVLREHALQAEFAAPPRARSEERPGNYAAIFGLGAHVLTPFDTRSTLGRVNAGALDLRLGAALSENFELAFEVALGSRALDARALSQTLGARGDLGTLANYTNRRGGTGLSGASALWFHLSARYQLADGPVRPYAGLFAGLRYEPLLFKSDHFLEACTPTPSGDLACGASQGYAIEAASRAFSLGPILGARTRLARSDRFAVDLRLEAQGHTTLWSNPELRFEGDVTSEALQTYERWRAIDYGSPTFDLLFLAAIDVRILI